MNMEGIDGHRTQHTSGPLMENEEISKRIYILGVGNLGSFVAHSLAGIPSRPPITLLMTRRKRQDFIDRDCSIDLKSRGMTETRRGFEAELLISPSQTSLAQAELNPSSGSDLQNNMSEASNGQPDLPSDAVSTFEIENNDKNDVANKLSEEDRNPITEGNLPSSLQVHTHGPDGSEMDSGIEQDEDAAAVSIGEGYGATQSRFADERRCSAFEPEATAREGSNIILNLVVTVKAAHTVKAIEAVIHRLTRESTIMFLQNGMGIIDEVNEKLFPDENHRPTYIIGVVSHGLNSTRSFSIVHAGEGTIALGAMPRMPMTESKQSEQLTELAASARYLLRTITRTPVFVAVGFPPTDLLQQQLDKLAVNCIINPLTALLDVNNGALLSNTNLTRVIRLLLAEISLVIKNLPELKNVPNVNMRFDTLRLERLVFSIANTTAANISSMLQDLRNGKPTEIDYINGYIVKRGQEMGVHCVMNYMLVHMVKGKRRILIDKGDVLPFVVGRER